MNNIQGNHNNNIKTQETNVKSGVSLDAGALIKQVMPMTNQTKKYANVDTKGKTDNATTGNGVIQNGPYSTQNNYLNDGEINC